MISRASYANTAACVRSRRPSFTRIRLTWVLIVDSATNSYEAISAFDRPWAIRTSTSVSRSVSSP